MIHRRGPRRRRKRTQNPVLRAQQDWVVYGANHNIWRAGTRQAVEYDLAYEGARLQSPNGGASEDDPKPRTF